MIKKSCIILFALSAFLFLGNAVAEARKECGGGPGHPPPIMRFAEELNLTENQISQIKDISIDTRKKGIDIRASIEKARIDMRELWEKGVPSEKEIDNQIDKISALKVQQAKLMAAARIKEMKVLTEDQLNSLKKLKMKARPFQGPKKQCCGARRIGCCPPSEKSY